MEKVLAMLDLRADRATVSTLATMAIAFVTAEQLYKFHSFTLEAGAFLATWWVLRRIAGLALK